MAADGDDRPTAARSEKPLRLIEGEDYFVENGLWVFTRAFLTQRGYCCESGCRHCPYGYERAKKSPAASNG